LSPVRRSASALPASAPSQTVPKSAPAAIAPEWPADSAIDEAAARSSPAEPPIEPAIAW
jgi:hypothetical protein